MGEARLKLVEDSPRPSFSGHVQAQLDLARLCKEHGVEMVPMGNALYFAAPAELLERALPWFSTRAIAVTCCDREELEILARRVAMTGFFNRLIKGSQSMAGTVLVLAPNKKALKLAAGDMTDCGIDLQERAILHMMALIKRDDVFRAFGPNFLVSVKRGAVPMPLRALRKA